MWNKLQEFLTSGSKLSSLRLKTVGTTITCCMAILIIVISEAFKEVANWPGAAAAIGALGVIIVGVIWGKNQGLKAEQIKS